MDRIWLGALADSAFTHLLPIEQPVPAAQLAGDLSRRPQNNLWRLQTQFVVDPSDTVPLATARPPARQISLFDGPWRTRLRVRSAFSSARSGWPLLNRLSQR